MSPLVAAILITLSTIGIFIILNWIWIEVYMKE